MNTTKKSSRAKAGTKPEPELIATPPATRTRLWAVRGTSATPRVTLDRSQRPGGQALKVTVVTQRLRPTLSKAGDEQWVNIKTHAVFVGTFAPQQAEAFMRLKEKGLTETPDNKCVADGLSLQALGGPRLQHVGFHVYEFPEGSKSTPPHATGNQPTAQL